MYDPRRPVLSSYLEVKLDAVVRSADNPAQDPKVSSALMYLIGVSHHPTLARYFSANQDPLTVLPSSSETAPYSLVLTLAGIELGFGADSITLPWRHGVSIYSPGEGEQPPESELNNAATLLQRIYKMIGRQVAALYNQQTSGGRERFEDYLHRSLENALDKRLSHLPRRSH